MQLTKLETEAAERFYRRQAHKADTMTREEVIRAFRLHVETMEKTHASTLPSVIIKRAADLLEGLA